MSKTTTSTSPDILEPKAKPKIHVQAVHGRMVHSFLPLTFDVSTSTPLDEIDSWTQCQLDAGKLHVV